MAAENSYVQGIMGKEVTEYMLTYMRRVKNKNNKKNKQKTMKPNKFWQYISPSGGIYGRGILVS